MLVTCTITPESIAKNRHNGINCPVAEAINERLKPQYYASVCSSQIGVYDKDTILHEHSKRHTFESTQLPVEVTQFVRQYDDALFNEPKPSPFQFQLDIPEHLLK